MENLSANVQNIRAQDKSINATRPLSFGSRMLQASMTRKHEKKTHESKNVRHNNIAALPVIQHVHMRDENGVICARGIVDQSIKNGGDVGGLILFPHRRPIQIIEVYDTGLIHKDELGQMMKDCIGVQVRWSKKRLESIDEVVQPNTIVDNAHDHFGFYDGILEENVNGEDLSNQRDSRGSTTAEASDFQPLLPRISSLPFEDGLPKPSSKRPYTMTNRTSKPPLGRVIGESRDSKCTFSNVQAAKASSKCLKKCLVNISEKEILNLQYEAWRSPQYEERASWIVQHLLRFYTEDHGTIGKDKFDFRLDNQPLCHGCYSLALGYSISRLIELKESIRSTSENLRRTSTIHGNSTKAPRSSIRVEATRVAFERYVRESGCIQPDRECRKKKDKMMMPLVLLPMNTERKDVIEAVNEEVQRLCGGKPLGRNEFYKMWREEFTNVQIPPHSRFSKCQTCWEYKTCVEASRSPIQKEAMKKNLQLHNILQREERKDYWRAKEDAILFSTGSLCLIVDGMDQNTTMVPKLRQSVKGIEDRYVKMHLCGVLVHGVGLYTDLWIDSHHKHDSNQVVTSILHVLGDVRRRRSNTLPLVLRIQADNCGRENKNQYMFGLCAALVGLKYFAEVYISFLIVRHTHEDIDQRFSVISGSLKSRDINSLKELLEMVRKGASHTKAFATSRHLEHVWDWKSFITPHLWTGLDAIICVSIPHHFRFYLKDNMPYVQKKNYARDPSWQPEEGFQYLKSLPVEGDKPGLAIVKDADEREVKSLEAFIRMKERCIARKQHVHRNVDAIEETRWLIDYLIDFLASDKLEARTGPFWPHEYFIPTMECEVEGRAEESMRDGFAGGPATTTEDVREVLCSLPPIEVSGYFGPMRDKPRNNLQGKKHRSISNDCGRTDLQSNRGAFPMFDALEDVKIGYFVAMCTGEKNREVGLPFFLGKVTQMRGLSKDTKSMLVTWYWPKPTRLQDVLGKWHRRYENCIQRRWEPSSKRAHWIDVDTPITSWVNKSKTKSETMVVGGTETEKEISIPKDQVHHLLEHMANMTEDIDEDRLENREQW